MSRENETDEAMASKFLNHFSSGSGESYDKKVVCLCCGLSFISIGRLFAGQINFKY